MARRKPAADVCNTLSSACAMVLGLPVSEMGSFEPRTVSERIALQYAARATRGDDNAFNVLATAADASAVDDVFDDALSAALRDLAAEMEAERVLMCSES